MHPEEARKYFPYLESGKIYVNHAAVSPLSTFVTEKIEAYLHQRSSGTIEDYPSLLAESVSAKTSLAEMLKTTADRIAFVDNTSNGLNILAQGIAWQEGDRILLNDLEFPSNVYPFLNLRRYGVEVDFVKSENGKVTVENIFHSLTPRTKLLSISFVQFLSGYRADLKEIGKVCKERNIIFAVDAIQGLGALRLDVQECHIDFLSCGTQKWMMSAMGLAFIFITQRLQSKLTPRYVGWLSVEDAWNILNYDLTLKSDAGVFQTGTINGMGVYMLNAAIALFKLIGVEQIEETILTNTEYFISRLLEEGFSPLLAGVSRKNLSGIVTMRPENAKETFEKLSSENIHCSLREGFIRFSPHFYNTKEEIELILRNLKK